MNEQHPIPQADLLAEIDAFLSATGMSATAFGRDAMNDPAFVASLRDGRDCRSLTVKRVRQFMQARSAEAAE